MSGININVGGGNAAFGNVVQGNGNTVSSSTTGASQSIVNHYGVARADIERLATEHQRPAAERDAALAHLDDLKKKAEDPSPRSEEGAGILATVRENFSWAWPAFKDFAKLAWPALLTLIGS